MSEPPVRPPAPPRVPTTPPQPGDLCPNCALSRLAAEPRGRVRCPLCGFTTAPPCT